MWSRSCLRPSLCLLVIATAVCAYVPASPTNSTAGGIDLANVSKLHLTWFSNGSNSVNVSYELVGNGSQGISKGPLIHFSETKANNHTPPTTTPWIAMVSCDFNATDADQEVDIFTLARDKGAVAAVLFSLWSEACVINPEYADPATFDQVFDIFSTRSLTSSHLIESQFGRFSATNESIYEYYNSKQLNDSATIINDTIRLGYPVAPGYLFATLQAYNATLDPGDPVGNTRDTGGSDSNRGKSTNTALAMVVLYAITGCVSFLFCVVIISGAVRAIRHPERYGPRSRNIGNDGDMGQSRARGLTRAILETFPIVKFGNSTQDARTHGRDKDVEGQSYGDIGDSTRHTTEINDWQVVDSDRLFETLNMAVVGNAPQSTDPKAAAQSQLRGPPQSDAAGSSTDTSAGDVASEGVVKPPLLAERDDVVPASIGRETCPICIVDFEEGDDLRQLPCEGKHCFHQDCVDPWLLELSSSCPICRHDFLALENMLSGSEHDHSLDQPPPTTNSSPAVQGNRFSRYLRFATRRRDQDHGWERDEHDPTDPYMPTARETAM